MTIMASYTLFTRHARFFVQYLSSCEAELDEWRVRKDYTYLSPGFPICLYIEIV